MLFRSQNTDEVEFGVMVAGGRRQQGIADQMLREAITWARNRGFKEVFMHCLGWNQPIKHICHKHGLETVNMLGDTEAELKLPPANWVTINKEIAIKQRNIYHRFLEKNQKWFQEIYG